MQNNLKRISSLVPNVFFAAASIWIFLIGLCFFIHAWSLHSSTSYILLPSTDDWMDVSLLSAYLQHQSITTYLFQKIGGHPQILIKSVVLLHYILGLTDYKATIALTVLLQLIPCVIFGYFIWKHSSFDTIIKIVLTPMPLLFFFEPNWSGMFRIIESHIWSWAYVFSYVAILCLLNANQYQESKPNKAKLLTYTAVVCAIIAHQFFAAAFGVWLALFYVIYSEKKSLSNYFPVLVGFVISLGIFLALPEAQDAHTLSLKMKYLRHHPLYFIDYFILLCGNTFHAVLQAKEVVQGFMCFLVGLGTVAISFLFIFLGIRNVKRSSVPPSLIERFLTATLIFSILIIFFIGFGRFQVMIEHPDRLASLYFFVPIYTLPTYAMNVPLVGLMIYYASHLKSCYKIGIYCFVVAYLLAFIGTTPARYYFLHNERIGFPDGYVPLYEYASLAIASGVTPESIAKSSYPFSAPVKALLGEITQINTSHKGFAKWPGKAFYGMIVGKDIPIANGQQCQGAINNIKWMAELEPKTLWVDGWAWDSISNSIPKWVFITDDKNKIMGVASGFMSQYLWQSKNYANWVAFVPNKSNKPLNRISLWVLVDGQEACFIQNYNTPR